MAGLPPRPPGYLPDGSPRWVRTFVIAELVGVPHEDRHKVFAWTERMMSNDDDDQTATPTN